MDTVVEEERRAISEAAVPRDRRAMSLDIFGVPDVQEWVREQRASKYCTAPGGGGLPQVAVLLMNHASLLMSSGKAPQAIRHLNLVKQLLKEVQSDFEALDQDCGKLANGMRACAQAAVNGSSTPEQRHAQVVAQGEKLGPILKRYPVRSEADHRALATLPQRA